MDVARGRDVDEFDSLWEGLRECVGGKGILCMESGEQTREVRGK